MDTVIIHATIFPFFSQHVIITNWYIVIILMASSIVYYARLNLQIGMIVCVVNEYVHTFL